MRLLAALKLISGLWFGSGLRSQSQGRVRRTRWREESSHSVPNSNASAKSLFSRSSSGRDCCPLLEAHTHWIGFRRVTWPAANLETVLLLYQLYFTRKFIQIHTYMYTHTHTQIIFSAIWTCAINTSQKTAWQWMNKKDLFVYTCHARQHLFISDRALDTRANQMKPLLAVSYPDKINRHRFGDDCQVMMAEGGEKSNENVVDKDPVVKRNSTSAIWTYFGFRRDDMLQT